MDKIDLGLGNSYGRVEAYEQNGKFYMSLGDWSGLDVIEISEKLFRAIKEEFE